MFHNRKNENMPLASASMTKRTQEQGFGLMNTDSANHEGTAGDSHHNDTTIPLPVISASAFPHWNMNETSHCYGKELAGVNSMIDSSQFQSSQDFQTDHQGEQQRHHLPSRHNLGFPCPEGYIRRPYQYGRPDNLSNPDNVMNAAFNLNSFEKPHSGGKFVTQRDSLAGRPQMVNPIGPAMSDNIGQPQLISNFGVPLYNTNQDGAEPLLTPGKLNESFMTVGSGSNIEAKSNSNIIPRTNVTGNYERTFLRSNNTYHNQLGSRNFLNPGLEMNGAFPGFPNHSEVISAHTGNHEVLFDSRPGLCSGPLYTFQWPPASDQSCHLRQVNRDLGLRGVKDVGLEFAGVGQKTSFERGMASRSLPIVGSQTLLCDNGQSMVNGQLVPSSIEKVTDRSPSVLLPEDNGRFSSQSFASPPFVVATGSTRRQDPSSNHGQSQVVGFVQQSNSPVGPHFPSDLGIQTGNGNVTAQVSRPSMISSLKRGASQPLSSTVLGQRKRSQTAHTFIHPSIPPWNRLAPSVPNTPQAIPPMIRAAYPLTPLATYPSIPPTFPTAWMQSAPSAPNITQTIPPLMQTPPFLPPHDKRISSLHPSSCTPPLPNQQLIARSLAQQHIMKAPIIPSAPNIAPDYIKYKDQTPEPIGYKCFLCKRDLSYTPEGPIFQPLAPPPAAVLSCGHTFHEQCLERITPNDQSRDPPCIPCALQD